MGVSVRRAELGVSNAPRAAVLRAGVPGCFHDKEDGQTPPAGDKPQLQMKTTETLADT